MRPYVILHNAVNLDGYVTGFDVDLGLYYELSSSWEEDATLAGCDTLLTGLAADQTYPRAPCPWGGKIRIIRPFHVRRGGYPMCFRWIRAGSQPASTTSAPAAFFLTDSMPFLHESLLL